MVSPSSCNCSRSTPWVDGCCGPMLRVILRGGVMTVSLTLYSGSGYRIILAQRIALPIVGQHDAGEIGMIAEAHAEQVESFALEPVGPAPDGCDGIDLRVVAGKARLDPNAKIPLERMEMIDHFEAGLGGVAVDPRDGAQTHELLVLLEEAADGNDLPGGDLEREFAAIEFGRHESGRIERFDRSSQRVVFQAIRQHFFSRTLGRTCAPDPRPTSRAHLFSRCNKSRPESAR